MGKNFITGILKPAGKWLGHAAKDTFHWTEKRVGQGINKALSFADKQTSKITDVFSNPTFLIVAGGIVVLLILMK